MTSDHPTFRNTATRFPLIDQSLRGLSQIMLQDNALTGLLFLVGVFLGSFTMGIALVLSVLIATLAAHFLKYETADINKGLYGFNAALVGVALILLCKPTVIVWGYIVLGSILSTLVQHFFITTRDHSLHFAFCARYLGNRIFSFLFFARTDNHLFSCNSCE